jgi:hypothetical protein
MIWLLSTAAYLVAGLVAARLTFVEMVDHPERHMTTTDRRNSRGQLIKEPADRFEAILYSAFAAPFWPLYLLRLFLIELLWQRVVMRPTPKERKAKAEKQARELVEIAKSYGLTSTIDHYGAIKP